MFKNATFIKSITDLKDDPGEYPQVLMIGRSNVGKSSFINALAGRKSLARVSNTPGKTITLNFYLIENMFYLVDAPGYGYARRSKSAQDDFIIMIERYLTRSKYMRLVCLLIDFKVGPTEDDLFTFQFLKNLKVPLMVVATKKDKVQKTHQLKRTNELKRVFSETNFVAYSSVTKENLDLIEQTIRNQVMTLG
ncbi:MAG: YihA family ribosome biogenesis GTP-binding protein [Acholeplasma sp.]|jgi:GTP-binding protein|nr:MAG: YihA family ribosome biogenesis GTP-binding protein [Acholeplasma sp.]